MEQKSSSFPAKFWSLVDSEKIRCSLCPRECILKPGQRGFCFVRQNINGAMILTTYGLNSGMAVDPIEKKPLYHFLPGSSVLSFGTAGCNLGCRFCQNWSISKSKEIDRLSVEAAPETVVKLALENDCKSVAFTYNDPVIFAEYAVDTAILLHQNGLKAVAVSAGYITAEARPWFFSHMDAANIDLKAFTEEFYFKKCFGSLVPVLETLKYIKKETDVWLEITNLLIPGENDSAEEIESMTQWIYSELGPDVPIHFSAFHPDYKMRDKERTPLATLIDARNIAIENGLNFVYTGNVVHDEGEITYCPKCHNELIKRSWYHIKHNALENSSACPYCGVSVPGIYLK